jgi:hypothetical protein
MQGGDSPLRKVLPAPITVLKPASILIGLRLLLANNVKSGQGFANGTITGEQEAMRTVLVVGRFCHGAKGVIFPIPP